MIGWLPYCWSWWWWFCSYKLRLRPLFIGKAVRHPALPAIHSIHLDVLFYFIEQHHAGFSPRLQPVARLHHSPHNREAPTEVVTRYVFPNSLMSILVIIPSSSNKYSARVFASSVLPTPVVPRKRMNRWVSGPVNQQWLLLMASTAVMASFGPTHLSYGCSSRWREFIFITLEHFLLVCRLILPRFQWCLRRQLLPLATFFGCAN